MSETGLTRRPAGSTRPGRTMNAYFRAVAVDFDGTLTEGDRPRQEVLEAIAELRRTDRKMLLVTGRMLSSLHAIFPDVQEHFDAVVVENGAMILDHGHERTLAPPVPHELDEALRSRGVPFERGQVILATKTWFDAPVMDAIRNLGLECQLVHNRSEVMVVPPGISKGHGVFEALGDIGLSHHNAIGIGDAENDHSLLETCELGVAVANAVEGLKPGADIVLPEQDGAGVAAFLRGPLLRGEVVVQSQRWRVEIGRFPEGTPATIPASQVNLLIAGGSKTGKSYLAGVLAERLIGLGYSVCVIDPEGDYEQLDVLRGVFSVGGKGPLPPPDDVGRLLQHRFGSVIVNMSLLPPAERPTYTREVLAMLERERDQCGLPHWILIDEAHVPFGGQEAELALGLSDFSRKGYCLVTYLPGELRSGVWQELDWVIALPNLRGQPAPVVDPLQVVARVLGEKVSEILSEAEFGDALMLPRRAPESARLFTVAPFAVGHVRHWHKYTHAQLPPSLRFFFMEDDFRPRREPGAGNIEEFYHGLATCSESVLRFHARRRDFSRWIRDVIQDTVLAESMRELEQSLSRTGSRPDIGPVRQEMLNALDTRYFQS